MNAPVPNTNQLLREVKNSIEIYSEEEATYKTVKLVDIYLVGSIFTKDFEPNQSDLDIVIILKNTKQTGVITGFDTFLREDRQNDLINACELPISKVDVGVYCSDTYHNYISDKKAYSCRYNRNIEI